MINTGDLGKRKKTDGDETASAGEAGDGEASQTDESKLSEDRSGGEYGTDDPETEKHRRGFRMPELM